jgi:hypothetical protein
VVALDQGRGAGLAPVVPIDSIDPRGRPRVHRQGGETHIDRTKRGTSHLAPRSVDFLWAADPYFYSVCGRAGAIGRTVGLCTEFSLYPMGDDVSVSAATSKRTAKLLVAGRSPDFLLANQAALREKLSVTPSAAERRSRVLDRLCQLLPAPSAVAAKLCFKHGARGHWHTHASRWRGRLTQNLWANWREGKGPLPSRWITCLGTDDETLCRAMPGDFPKH